MNFLGEKVFGGRKDYVIAQEVYELIEFLKDFLGRELGQNVDPTFCREYCRFAIVIVGRAKKLARESITPYIRYIQKTVAKEIETIYLLAPQKNTQALRQVASAVDREFEPYAELKFSSVVRRDDREIEIPAFLMILRAKGRKLYYQKGA